MYETFQFILHTVEQHLAFNHFLYILHVFSLTYLIFNVILKFLKNVILSQPKTFLFWKL